MSYNQDNINLQPIWNSYEWWEKQVDPKTGISRMYTDKPILQNIQDAPASPISEMEEKMRIEKGKVADQINNWNDLGPGDKAKLVAKCKSTYPDLYRWIEQIQKGEMEKL